METNSSYDPLAALQDAESARASVASRTSAPRYYYPVLGLVTGALVGAAAVGGPVSILCSGLCAVACGLLVNRYRAATGVWVTYSTAGRARGPWTAFIAGLLVLLALALWVQLDHHSGWWGLPLGLAAFAMTQVTGAAMEPRLRAAIRAGEAGPAVPR